MIFLQTAGANTGKMITVVSRFCVQFFFGLQLILSLPSQMFLFWKVNNKSVLGYGSRR